MRDSELAPLLPALEQKGWLGAVLPQATLNWVELGLEPGPNKEHWPEHLLTMRISSNQYVFPKCFSFEISL